MNALDPNQERDRLTRLYAGMGETELREVAEVAGSLTDIAKEVLAGEVSRRGLTIDLSDASVSPAPVEVRTLVTVREFRSLPEAILAKSILESAGIECFLANDILIRMDWFWSNFLGGVKLRVKQEDHDAATSLLDRDIPDKFDVEGIGEYKQPSCPSCGSLDISLQALDAIGISLSADDCYWKCQRCTHKWKAPDGDLADESSSRRENQ